MTLFVALWAVGLGLQVTCIAFCFKHMLLPGSFPRWREVWMFRAVGDICIMYRGFRILLLLWSLNPGQPADADEIIDAVVQVLMGEAFLRAHVLMAQIFGPPLSVEPQPPAQIVIDADSRVRQWNPAATQLFGWSAGEMLGQDLAARLIPLHLQGAHRAGVARWLAAHPEGPWPVQRLRVEALHKDGTAIPVQVEITPVLRADGTMLFHGTVHKLVPV